MIPTWITSSDGAVYINDLTRYVKSTILVPPAGQNPLTTPAAAGAAIPTFSAPVVFEGGEDGVTEIYSLMGAHQAGVAADVQARLEVEIKDSSYRRFYMNRPILANHVFGTNLNPFFLSESIFLESQQVLNLQFYNRSVAGQSVYRMAMEARKLQASALAQDNVTRRIAEMRRRKTFLTPAWLTSRAAIQIPAGGTVPAFFDVPRDYFFYIFEIMASTITTGVAGDTQEVISWEAFDAKTQRPLQDLRRPVTLNTGAGNAQFPFILPTPLLVEPRTTIQINFNNLVTDQPTEVFFTFAGVSSFQASENPWADVLPDQPARSLPTMGAP